MEKKNDLSLLVTTGKVPAGTNSKGEQVESKTIVGFGKLEPNEFNQNAVGGKEALYKISSINSFLKSVDATELATVMKCNENGKDIYMKADEYLHQGTSKSGAGFAFNKIRIELEPAKVDLNTGEVTQKAQNLYATKYSGNRGWQFDMPDKNSELIDKFNARIKDGVEFTLSANKDSTIDKYQQLRQTLNQIDKSAMVGIDFEQGKGAVLKSIEPLNKSGEKTGETKILDTAKKVANKAKGLEK